MGTRKLLTIRPTKIVVHLNKIIGFKSCLTLFNSVMQLDGNSFLEMSSWTALTWHIGKKAAS